MISFDDFFGFPKILHIGSDITFIHFIIKSNSCKGSTPKALIKNNPAFALQRANMAEFGGCFLWSSLLRTALFKLEHLFGGYYFSGFMALAKTIRKHDEMGKRVVVLGLEIWPGTAGSIPDDVLGIGTMKIVECIV